MTNTINISEVLFSLQDKMTVGGSISAEQRSFYTTFRRKLEEAPGGRSPADILELLNQTRIESEGKFSDGEFNEFVAAVLSKIEHVEHVEYVEHVEESDIQLEAEPMAEFEPAPVEETSPIQNNPPPKGILSRFQSLSVGILAIIGAATVLSLVMFYLTQ